MVNFTLVTICTAICLVAGLETPVWPASCSFEWKKSVSDATGGDNGVTEGTTFFSKKNKSYRFDQTGSDGTIFIFPEEGKVYWRTPDSCTTVDVNKFENSKPIPNPLPSLAGYEKNENFTGPGEKWEFHLDFKGIRLNHTILLKYVKLGGTETPVPISAEYRTTAISDPKYLERFDFREYFNYSPNEPDSSVWILDRNKCKFSTELAEMEEILKTARFRNAPGSVKNASPENW